MNLFKRQVFLLLLSTCTFLICHVVSCDLPESERFQCGYDSITSEECWTINCCYNDSTTRSSPKCYYKTQDAAGGPIRHSNGLCVFPNGSTSVNTLLVWSSNCFSRNAIFLVTHDYPTHHIASGKCILPQSSDIDNPGDRFALVLGTKDCNSGTIKFRRDIHGKLRYFYLTADYEICLEVDGGPLEGDQVMFSKAACSNHKHCPNLSYVYQKKIKEGRNGTITCPTDSSIHVTWANYGHLATEIPAIFDRQTMCTTHTTTNNMRKQCKELKCCHLNVSDTAILGKSCSFHEKYLVIRYTCEPTKKPAPPYLCIGCAVTNTHFTIYVGCLKNDDKYVQIIVMKISNDSRPKDNQDTYKNIKAYGKGPAGAPYITTELSRHYYGNNFKFTVGDSKRYSKSTNSDVGFLNAKLEPGTYYSVFQRTFKNDTLYYDSEWMGVVMTANYPETDKKSDNTNTTLKPETPRPKSESKRKNLLVILLVLASLSLLALIIIIVILLIVFRKKLGCYKSVPQAPQPTQLVVDQSTACKGYMELALLSQENENHYQGLVDQENHKSLETTSDHVSESSEFPYEYTDLAIT